MKLENLLTKFKPKEEIPQHFFAIEINDDSVKSAVWTVADGHTKVVKIGSTHSWNGQDQEKLLELIDQSISQASDNLDQEPSGAIFGLPETWLNKDNINQEKKALLKNLCQKLDLKPLGFVVTHTAVIQYLRIEEGTPPSAIFLQLQPGELTVSLVKLGKVVGSQLVGRSEDLGQDVEEGLSRFQKIDTLPARMILYDGKSDFEEDKQQLISYDWQEKLPFIHFPKVESLPLDTSIKAISLAGGSEVAKSLGFTIKPHHKPTAQKSSSSKITPKSPPSAASLGFVVNQDISKTSPFVKSKSEPQPQPKDDEPIAQEADESIPEPEPDSTPQSDASTDSSPLLFKSLSQTLSKFPSALKLFLTRLKSTSRTPKLATLIGLGFLAIFIAIFSAYWFIPKAAITIFVEPKTIEEDLELIIDPTAATLDLASTTLPGESVTISVEGEKSAPTTGNNLVGDSATGRVSLYNKTSQTKTFSKGAVLIGPDNLAFILDEDITVASRSATEDSEGIITITPGKADSQITAKSIGSESNLASATRLTFKQFSEDDYYAKTTQDLSGGSSREVKAVSESDQTTLLENLTSELKLKAKQALEEQVGGDKSIVNIDDQDQIITKTFNHDEGEEADNLKLTAKLEYTALAYNQKDLDLLLSQSIKDSIPENFTLSDSSEIDIQPAALNPDDTATAAVIFKARLIPKLDFSDIKSNLKGKFPSVTQEYLASLPSFVRADIVITPNLPKQLKTFPRLTKNIILEVKTNQ